MIPLVWVLYTQVRHTRILGRTGMNTGTGKNGKNIRIFVSGFFKGYKQMKQNL